MFLQYIIIAQKDERGMNHLWSKCVLRLNVFRREGIFLTGKGKVWYNVYGGDSKLLFSGGLTKTRRGGPVWPPAKRMMPTWVFIDVGMAGDHIGSPLRPCWSYARKQQFTRLTSCRMMHLHLGEYHALTERRQYDHISKNIGIYTDQTPLVRYFAGHGRRFGLLLHGEHTLYDLRTPPLFCSVLCNLRFYGTRSLHMYSLVVLPPFPPC